MPISWVTVVWSMMASACLTLSAMYFGVWWKNRSRHAHLLFSVTAAAMAALAACELWMMRAATPQELLTANRWAHVPLCLWLISIAGFVRVFLGAGRRWALWIIVSIRILLLIPNFQPGHSLTFTSITAPLQQIRFLGEAVTIPVGTPNPWLIASQSSAILLLIFVADASVTAWRRGDRRMAVRVGGSVEFALFTSWITSLPVVWGGVRAPFVFSLPFMVPVLVMGYELSRSVLRAAELADELKAGEAELRDNQVRLQASNQQIMDLFGRLIEAQETERSRIARDLHDDAGQRIAAISIALSGLKRKVGSSPPEATVAALASMQRDLAALAEELRQVSHELHPTLLQHTGLVPSLNVVCTQFGARHGVAVVFRADADLGPIGDEAALALFRVVQESLHNVAKHSGATQVEVALTAAPDGVRLTIADNGKGFDLAEVSQRASGLGLLSIDERVRLLKGTVQITTAPGAGTTVRVNVPVQTTA